MTKFSEEAEEVRAIGNECKLESIPEAIVRGYHIWWCKTHNQPHAWCLEDIAVELLEKERQKKKAKK